MSQYETKEKLSCVCLYVCMCASLVVLACVSLCVPVLILHPVILMFCTPVEIFLVVDELLALSRPLDTPLCKLCVFRGMGIAWLPSFH